MVLLISRSTGCLSSQGACQCASLTFLATTGCRLPLHQAEETLNALKEAQIQRSVHTPSGAAASECVCTVHVCAGGWGSSEQEWGTAPPPPPPPPPPTPPPHGHTPVLSCVMIVQSPCSAQQKRKVLVGQWKARSCHESPSLSVTALMWGYSRNLHIVQAM